MPDLLRLKALASLTIVVVILASFSFADEVAGDAHDPAAGAPAEDEHAHTPGRSYPYTAQARRYTGRSHPHIGGS